MVCRCMPLCAAACRCVSLIERSASDGGFLRCTATWGSGLPISVGMLIAVGPFPC